MKDLNHVYRDITEFIFVEHVPLTAEVGTIENCICAINEKLADIETERETILAAISGNTFEQRG